MSVVVFHLIISPSEANASMVLCIFNCCLKSLTKIHYASVLKQKVVVYAEGTKKAEQQGRNLIFVEQMFIIVRMVSIPYSEATNKF